MRTQFTSHGDTAMTIAYDDVVTGMRQCRTFSLRGDRVQELLSSDVVHRVHESLAASGTPLLATADNFHAVLAAQFMMMMQADRKAVALTVIQAD